MDNCVECQDKRIFPYRIVQTIYERNTIPCIERLNGMIVTVVGSDNSYKQYILKGGDPCVNENWKEYNLSAQNLQGYLGHETLLDPVSLPITDEYLNSRFPEALEGFRVTILSLNTTFMKIFNEKWLMSNNVEL